jgi:hypothetical protein
MKYLSLRSALTEVHTLTEDTVNVLLILAESYVVVFPHSPPPNTSRTGQESKQDCMQSKWANRRGMLVIQIDWSQLYGILYLFAQTTTQDKAQRRLLRQDSRPTGWSGSLLLVCGTPVKRWGLLCAYLVIRRKILHDFEERVSYFTGINEIYV